MGTTWCLYWICHGVMLSMHNTTQATVAKQGGGEGGMSLVVTKGGKGGSMFFADKTDCGKGALIANYK